MANKFNVALLHTGPLSDADGDDGTGLTTTCVVEMEEHPFRLAVTVYVPAFVRATALTAGFCEVDEKPAGPLHW